MLWETCPVNLNIRPKWPCSGKSINNWESPAAPQGIASLIPRTPYLMCIRSMLALWLPTWLCPMPLTHSQTSCPWHLWALGLCLGCLASLNLWFQALSSWVGQIRTSGCYSFSYMFALLTAPGFAIWTPTAVKDITILFLSCICLEAKGRSENKNIIVCFFWRQNRLTHVMWVLQTQCCLNSPA